MTRSVATALQQQLDTLFADFSARLVRLIREASLNDLVPGGRPASPAEPQPASRREPPAAVDRPRAAPPKRGPTSKSAPEGRGSGPAAERPKKSRPRSLEDTILSHLREGVLLTVDELLAFGPAPSAIRSVLDTLAQRGVIGFSGQDPDRFVFARTGKPQAVPAVTPAETRVETPAETPAPVTEVSAEAEPVPPSEPSAPPASEGRHPFVVRRKKTAS